MLVIEAPNLIKYRDPETWVFVVQSISQGASQGILLWEELTKLPLIL